MILLVALLSAFCVITQGCPTIVSKSNWGARSTKCTVGLRTPVQYVFIHHTAGASCTSKSACINQVKATQSYHIDKRDYCDIGYSFLVGEDGLVYEGRGWKTQGAHTYSFNHLSIGISVIGTFSKENPNTKALNAVKSLISCGVSQGYIRGDYTLKGHRNVFNTDCPGNQLYNTIKAWPRFKA